MAWRSGSLSRTLRTALRSPVIRPAFRRPPSPPLPSRHFSFTASPRTFAELGAIQSLLPFHSVVADARLTSHIVNDARACCELSQGT